MSNIERADYIKVNLSPKNSFDLSFRDARQKRGVVVSSEGFGEGTTLETQDLFRTVVLAHLIAKHFPKKIETNFPVEHTTFLDELYKHYNNKPPRIIKSKDQIKPNFIRTTKDKEEKKDFANAHSGGLDSLYRLLDLVVRDEKAIAVHLRNLNPKGNKREGIASKKQSELLGVIHKEVRVTSSTDNSGFNVMKTRDMLLALATSIASAPFDVNKVLIEGGMQTTPDSHFSEYVPAWEFFNKLIAETGVSSVIEGVDPGDVETVGEVIKLEKELRINILPLVQNCFSAPFQISNHRNKWERETPQIAKRSPDHWCGSCIKCRRMTLGRLFYNDERFGKVSKKEKDFFVQDTYRWMEKYPGNLDLIGESFKGHLKDLKER